MTFRILEGDCRDRLAELDENSIDSAVTDPPYGLNREPDIVEVLQHWLAGDDYVHTGGGFMGESWDSFVPGPSHWRAVFRVLKPGAHLLAFFGSRTYDMGVIAIRLAGFEIRDEIAWLYGSGFPKGGNRDGKGTCLKPAHEPIVVARKPLTCSSVAKNEARFGTGAINIDACRIHADDAQGGAYTVKRLKPGATLEATGGNWRPETGGLEYHDEMKPGRWPANVIHDGSDEVLTGFPHSTSGGYPAEGGQRKRGSVYGAPTATGKQVFTSSNGSAARFFYCAKASKADRDDGLDAFEPQQFVQFQTGNGESGEASSLSEGRDTVYRNSHPTVKPTDLMRYLCRLYTPPGGTILDPFMGSGSTGRGAVLEGFDFVGCELTEKYVPIARARIEATAAAARQSWPEPPSATRALSHPTKFQRQGSLL